MFEQRSTFVIAATNRQIDLAYYQDFVIEGATKIASGYPVPEDALSDYFY